MKKIKTIFLRFFKIYAGFSGIVAKISIIFCYIFLVAVTLIIGLAVFYRYVLNNPLQWAEEIARYLLIWLSLVAASVAVKERKHINLTTVVRRLPQRMSLMIEIVLYAIIVFLLTNNSFQATRTLLEAWRSPNSQALFLCPFFQAFHPEQ